MSTRYQLLVVFVTCTTLVSIVTAQDSPDARTSLPRLQLHGPASGARYADSSNIAIHGRIEPPLEIDVRISLYQVLDDEQVLPEGGVDARAGRDGRFSANLHPRAGGWSAGTLRCVVSGGMRTLQDSAEFTVLDQTKPIPIVLPKDSGITVDLGEPSTPDDPDEVFVGQTFYLTGGFPWEGASGVGPHVPIHIIHFDPVRMMDVIAQSHSAVTYVNGQGVAVFDAPIVAPPILGAYVLQVRRPFVGDDGLINHAVIERPLSIAPTRD